MRADDRAIDDKFRMPLFVVFERRMVCALSALGLGRSVVMHVNVLIRRVLQVPKINDDEMTKNTTANKQK
jgi:hypothetical protein